MKEKSLLCLDPRGFHRVAYTEWGDPANPRVLICAHGLTRNSRDFDYLARTLAWEYRVVCVDVVGRGKSEWLESPEYYGYPLYVSDLATLVARVTDSDHRSPWRRLKALLFRHGAPEQVDWVGTSMGGLIGMMLAARKNSPIRRLVLNDVGPVVPKAALNRLAQYVGKDPRFETLEEFEAYLRHVFAPFGPLTHDQWRHLALHGHRRTDDGGYAPNYDPAIGNAFKMPAFRDVELWPVWDAVTCPVLVIRGAESDLLPRETVRQMQERGPGARMVEFPGVGHAPALMSGDQIQVVRDFLLGRERRMPAGTLQYS